jgi:hypothetical protein
MFRLAPLIVLAACEEPVATPLGVTLEDGQVLIGEVTTDVLVLEGVLGTIEVPLADVGMVVPVEGRTLADSHGHVTVWLRNGSELQGAWAEPELAIGLSVGGKEVGVDVPTDRMQALQLQGSEAWPSAGLFRVRTSWGDDFLVDPEETRITLENDLGTFAPLLAECAAVGPVGAPGGDWRIELLNGTVLVGPLKAAAIAFALPMGPEEVTVPLDKLVGLTRGSWSDGEQPPETATPLAFESSVPAPAPMRMTAEPALNEKDGWFDNRRLQDAKR